MKYLIMMASIFTFSILTCCGQDEDITAREVPSVVANAFKMKFKDAADIEWEKINNQYEVEFELDYVDYQALFDKEGSVIRHKSDINTADLPAPVKETIDNSYTDRAIDETEKLVEGGNTYYQVEFDGSDPSEYVFAEDGKEVQQVVYWD